MPTPTPATPATPAAPAAPAAPYSAKQAEKDIEWARKGLKLPYKRTLRKYTWKQVFGGVFIAASMGVYVASVAQGSNLPNVFESANPLGTIYTETVNYIQNVIWPKMREFNTMGLGNALTPSEWYHWVPAAAGISVGLFKIIGNHRRKRKINEQIDSELKPIAQQIGGRMTR